MFVTQLTTLSLPTLALGAKPPSILSLAWRSRLNGHSHFFWFIFEKLWSMVLHITTADPKFLLNSCEAL